MEVETEITVIKLTSLYILVAVGVKQLDICYEYELQFNSNTCYLRFLCKHSQTNKYIYNNPKHKSQNSFTV